MVLVPCHELILHPRTLVIMVASYILRGKDVSKISFLIVIHDRPTTPICCIVRLLVFQTHPQSDIVSPDNIRDTRNNFYGIGLARTPIKQGT